MVGTNPNGRNPDDQRKPTPVQLFRDAVWDADADELSTVEAMMCLAYADHVNAPPFDRAFVTDRRLMHRCKIRSKGTVTRVRESLVVKGWLAPLDPDGGEALTLGGARERLRARRSLTYRLDVPGAPMSGASGALTIGAAVAPMSGATTTVGAPMVERGAPIAAPMSGARCPDGRGLPSLLHSDMTLSPEDERDLKFWIKSTREIRVSVDAYLAAARSNGTYPNLVTAWIEARTAAPRPDPLPEWCRRCGDLDAGTSNPAIKNGRFRTHNGLPTGTPCPNCHPTAKGNTA